MQKPKTDWERKKEQPFIKAAMIFTKCDIQKFKQYLMFLQSEKMSTNEKKQLTHFLKRINDAVNEMKSEFDERNFNISYRHYFENHTCHELAWEHYNDKSTVVKMNQKFILHLSKKLYPELHSISNGD